MAELAGGNPTDFGLKPKWTSYAERTKVGPLLAEVALHASNHETKHVASPTRPCEQHHSACQAGVKEPPQTGILPSAGTSGHERLQPVISSRESTKEVRTFGSSGKSGQTTSSETPVIFLQCAFFILPRTPAARVHTPQVPAERVGVPLCSEGVRTGSGRCDGGEPAL